MAMSEQTWARHVKPLVERFKAAEAAGLIKQWGHCYSPQDTLADTRYVYVDHTMGTSTVYQREAQAVLSGLGA